MNARECDILNILLEDHNLTQRQIALRSGHSLGSVNLCIKSLTNSGYIDVDMRPTQKAAELSRANSPENAIILAAGYGLRMIPVNSEIPKGLLEVKGERLIERLIRQLQDAGIRKIFVVVGFMKEQYDYLIDEFDVELVVNPSYSVKNNLHSMKLVAQHLHNSYVLPCDLWCKENPFRKRELHGWYMINDSLAEDSMVMLNRKMELVAVPEDTLGNGMIGIAYLPGEQAATVRENILLQCKDRRNDDAFWEIALFQKDRMILSARTVSTEDCVEINTFEQLREFDCNSNQLRTDALSVIQKQLNAGIDEIKQVSLLKKGMTNRSFYFKCRDAEYIMRIPGEGVEQLIKREKEAAVYRSLTDQGVSDDLVYMDPISGYKISRFLREARCCDPNREGDVRRCMDMLRSFHEKKLKVAHRFDVFESIEFYQSLWGSNNSAYRDYEQTKAKVMSLAYFIEKQPKEMTLCHIDAVHDNFLFHRGEDGTEKLSLVDWEYAGMQDPHLDIAMFAIYAMYDRSQIDRLISLYFANGCDAMTKVKIYAYISAGGLLWSNWCEYKRYNGVEFGEYSLSQYRYAKEYYKTVLQELEMMGEKECIRLITQL